MEHPSAQRRVGKVSKPSERQKAENCSPPETNGSRYGGDVKSYPGTLFAGTVRDIIIYGGGGADVCEAEVVEPPFLLQSHQNLPYLMSSSQGHGWNRQEP
ncbi:hypothetical protein DM860_009564 [Cuscuta australis]|uniref:Uncharacterized protein n=1 Tax=Cuscuta australis TaxID=267555 RepID=A0A328DKA7_9ASTE|nr:hypothetical protein DM860_009564 [Cuscuta australis]